MYQLIKRKEPAFLEFGPGYEDQLQNWLCKPKRDLIAIKGVGGMGTLDCHGIETDVVLNVGWTCKKGCGLLLNPVAMTRAKSMLILSNFEAADCDVCMRARHYMNGQLSVDSNSFKNNLDLEDMLQDDEILDTIEELNNLLLDF